MPTININGGPPGGGPRPYQGAYHGTVQEPGAAQRAQQFDAARAAQQRQNRPGQQAQDDYDRALAQQAAQFRADTRAQARRARDEQTQARRQAQAQARLNRITEQEIAQRERELNQARQRALRRGLEEYNLRRVYDTLAHRADTDLTPASLRALQRSAMLYRGRQETFRRRWGGPANAPDITGLETGLGSEQGAYRVQNIRRLGFMGARAADERSFVALARSERELSNIEKSVREQLAFWRSPAQRANVQRQENQILLASLIRQEAAVARAREQIAAAKGGMGPLTAAVGGFGGRLGLIRENPLLRMVGGAAMMALGAPYTLNKMYAGLVGQETPYINFRLAMAQMGRAGGFSPAAMEQAILPAGLMGYVPSQGQAARSRIFGLGPEDYIRAWQTSGMNLRTPEQVTGTAEAIRMAHLAPGMALGEQQIGQLYGLGRTLGATTAGSDARNDYFRRLQQVMILATAKGVDATKLATTWTAVLQGQARGTAVNVPGSADFVARMMSSGAPSMRSGEGIVSLMENIRQSAQSLGPGGNVPGNVMLSAWATKRGGMPRTEADLQKALGFEGGQWNDLKQSNPTFNQLVTNYMDAIQQNDGPGAAKWFGEMIANQPEAYLRIQQEAFRGAGPNIQGRMIQSVTGGTGAQAAAVQATAGRGFTAGGTAHGMAPYVPPEIMAAATAASQATGVPLSVILGIAAAEGHGAFNLNAVSPKGAIGPMQVMPGTGAMFGYSPEDLKDINKNFMAGALYLRQGMNATMDPQELARGYNWGYGRLPQIRAGQMPDETRAYGPMATNFMGQYNSTPMQEFNRLREGETANLKASETIYNEHNKALDLLTTSVNAAQPAIKLLSEGFDVLTVAAKRASDALNRIHERLGLGPVSPPTGMIGGVPWLEPGNAPLK